MMTGRDPDNKRSENMANLRKLPREVIGGGLLKLEQVQVICPACRQQVEAVATDGWVKGYCAVAGQYIDFPIEAQLAPQTVGTPVTAETRAKISASHEDKHRTAEARAKMSAARIGKHHTAETRAKMRRFLRW